MTRPAWIVVQVLTCVSDHKQFIPKRVFYSREKAERWIRKKLLKRHYDLISYINWINKSDKLTIHEQLGLYLKNKELVDERSFSVFPIMVEE